MSGRLKKTWEGLGIETQEKWGIRKSRNGLTGCRFYPHATQGEGFFISAIRKTESQEEIRIKTKGRPASLPKKSSESLARWIYPVDDFHFFNNPDTIHFIPRTLEHELLFLQQQLHVLLAGTALATLKQDKLVPEHSSALSIRLNPENFPVIDLSREEALQYLRKGSLTTTVTTPGFALVRYNNLPIGWVNVLSNRINNLYPASWRIRM
jgi:NOL1/NOP2/fmu family ribosome biogenesis protein